MILRVLNTTVVLLVLSICVTANGRVQTVRFQSKLVGASLPYNVILPSDYDRSRTTRYPVLYLLHGLTGHYSDWVSRSNVADYASQYRLIVVMPEGNDSWYANSATVPTEKYESYLIDELIPDVQQRYRTIEARYGRAIAGLSMGGYGAFKFGLKSPATFIFAASMSGAFGVTRFTEQDGNPLWSTSVTAFGPAGSEARKANDLFELIEKLSAAKINGLPYFYFDCGTEDSLRNFSSNRQLSALMYDKRIPHEYRELPGDHSWGYWDRQIQEVLAIASQKLRIPRLKRVAGA
ncbi:MAG TPA: alpha/beta hydrolase family protein [Pyrinomonadaceae bacterium]|nr:alpha/beta hydrolase family protein [Pyrinomonadaceae bacterium]